MFLNLDALFVIFNDQISHEWAYIILSYIVYNYFKERWPHILSIKLRGLTQPDKEPEETLEELVNDSIQQWSHWEIHLGLNTSFSTALKIFMIISIYCLNYEIYWNKNSYINTNKKQATTQVMFILFFKALWILILEPLAHQSQSLTLVKWVSLCRLLTPAMIRRTLLMIK